MISHILTVTAVTLILRMLYSASKRKANEDEQGNLVLQLPKFYWFFGAFMISVGIALLVVANFYVEATDDKEIVLYMSLGAIILGGFLFTKGYISKILISETDIVETGIFGQITQININEIESISFGIVSQELTIKSKKKKIKAHIHLVGFGELVEKLIQKTGKTPTEMGLPTNLFDFQNMSTNYSHDFRLTDSDSH